MIPKIKLPALIEQQLIFQVELFSIITHKHTVHKLEWENFPYDVEDERKQVELNIPEHLEVKKKLVKEKI